MYELFFLLFQHISGEINIEGRQVWAEPIHKSEKLNLSNYDDDVFFLDVFWCDALIFFCEGIL